MGRNGEWGRAGNFCHAVWSYLRLDDRELAGERVAVVGQGRWRAESGVGGPQNYRQAMRRFEFRAGDDGRILASGERGLTAESADSGDDANDANDTSEEKASQPSWFR